jgi:hypothetical protein
MDMEFHYHMTYLIAARAGFSAAEAATIAYASQFVDDNTEPWTVVGAPGGAAYASAITQSMDPFEALDQDREATLFPIYMAFHFIPGEPSRESAWRKDGRMHFLNTTPNSLFARTLLKQAIRSRNLFRIGIAAHAYADTWAHQNFAGYADTFNCPAMKNPLGIGHLLFGHHPDPPGHIWADPRLVGHQREIDNTGRCILAAKHLFHHLWMGRPAGSREPDEGKAIQALCDDLMQAIGPTADGPGAVKRRLAKYDKLGRKPEFGGQPISEFLKKRWFDEAVRETGPGKGEWKTPATFHETAWFKFQEGAKKHRTLAWSLISAGLEDRMELQIPQGD